MALHETTEGPERRPASEDRSKTKYPAARRFFETLRREKGLGETQVRSTLKLYLSRQPDYEDDRGFGRNILEYLRGDRLETDHVEMLSCYCRDEHKLEFPARYFSNDGYALDRFEEFAQAAGEVGSGYLRDFEGEFVIIRAGADEIRGRREPVWTPSTYKLSIMEVGQGGRFEFKCRNNSGVSWAGSAVSCGRILYLAGFDHSKALDMGTFILSEHENRMHRPDLLVGVQLCFLSAGREVVARRITAVRQHPRGRKNYSDLTKIAEGWITDGGLQQMGLIVTFTHDTPVDDR